MPNPEKLKNQEPSEEVIETPEDELKKQELSEKNKEIEYSQEKVDDLKGELPITKEEAKDAGDALQEWFKIVEEHPKEANEALMSYMNEYEKFSRPLITLAQGFAKGMENAIDKGNFKLSEEDLRNYHPEILLAKVLETALKENINLMEKNDESGQYFVNPDGLFNVINKLEKKDRKFIKKALKAIAKTRENEKKEHIKHEKKELKRVKKARKQEIDRINS